jgi:predicted DCC family thiol-disulfide oxidoreductase YuxK
VKRIFYDDNCPFCVKIINYVKKLDKKSQFTFTSLDGKKAKTLFSGNYGFLRKKRSIVFLEGKRVWVKSNAAFRLIWLLGGKYKYLGSLFVIPGFLFNPFFSLAAKVVKK